MKLHIPTQEDFLGNFLCKKVRVLSRVGLAVLVREQHFVGLSIEDNAEAGLEAPAFAGFPGFWTCLSFVLSSFCRCSYSPLFHCRWYKNNIATPVIVVDSNVAYCRYYGIIALLHKAFVRAFGLRSDPIVCRLTIKYFRETS